MPTLSCVKIVVLNLPAEARAQLGSNETSVELDTPADFALRLSKDAGSRTRLDEWTVEGALRTELDSTPVNDAALMAFYSPFILDNRTNFLPVRVLIDGLPSEFNRLYVNERSEPTRKWVVELRLPEDHWVYAAQKKKINTIDLGDVTFTIADLPNNWADDAAYDGTNRPYQLMLADYGGWTDQREPLQESVDERRSVVLEDLRPVVNLNALLHLGFCEIGYTLNCPALDTDYARRLFAYLLKPDFYKESSGGTHGLVLRHIAFGEHEAGHNTPISFDEEDYDPGGHNSGVPGGWYIATYVNLLPFAGCYKFSYSGEVKNPGSDTRTLIWLVADSDLLGFTGEGLNDPYSAPTYYLAAGETRFISFSVSVTLQPGQFGSLYPVLQGPGGKLRMLPGGVFTVTPCDKTLHRGDVVPLKNLLHPDYTLLDALKGWVSMIGGRMDTDTTGRTVSIYPQRDATVHGTGIEGFVQRYAEPLDITNEVVRDSARLIPIRPDLKRYTRLQFADAGDPYIQSLNLDQPAHSRTITNGLDLPDGTTEVKNPFFEPTLEGQPTKLKVINGQAFPYLPRLLDNTNGQASYNIGPRIFYNFGVVKQINPNLAAEFAAVPWEDAGGMAEFAYLTQARTWELDPTPTIDGSVVYGSRAADLFVTFLLGMTQEQRAGNIVEILWNMTYQQYRELGSFRRRVKFPLSGRPALGTIENVRDFECCGKTPTPVQVFIEPPRTDCCDLPCSCVFRTCDYYQDLGVYVRQDTLDALSVTSFRVDGVQMLVDAVPLGLPRATLNLIEIAGQPYVTNLVDALNIAVTQMTNVFFSFAYSNHAHPEDGLRYFKIKRPTCQAFEIIISDGDGDVYRYTESSMETNWNGSGYEPFGYGGTPVDEPENCVETREY